jgi:opacity protein-like surface antigen
MRPFLFLAAAAAAALVTASGARAGQPVTQTLVPSPPAFETCKAVGNGTLCEGSIQGSYGPIDATIYEGFPVCGAGAGSFHVFDSASENEVARRVYNENGLLVLRDRHDRYVGRLSNPAAGTALPYTNVQEITDELAVPGDLGSATRTIAGQLHIESPDGGAPVLIGAGRVTFAPDGSVEAQSGPTGFLGLLFGDPAVTGPICAGLGG